MIDERFGTLGRLYDGKDGSVRGLLAGQPRHWLRHGSPSGPRQWGWDGGEWLNVRGSLSLLVMLSVQCSTHSTERSVETSDQSSVLWEDLVQV